MVTPRGAGGIGKIVVSGHDALDIVNALFKGKGINDLRNAASRKLYYGHIYDGNQRVDEVILNVSKQGDSFTGEDVVEINCHGGIRVVMRIYECLQSAGAEGVGCDSLLLQSFKNRKIDFIQKEALQAIIDVQTKLGVKVLLDQYAGALSRTLKEGIEIIEGFRQGSYDPPQNISPAHGCGSEKDVASISTLTTCIGSLLKSAPFGLALTTPRVLVILGKPNAGKSTLINAILGEERMIVHHEPGTTRDYVSEFISVEGIPFELVDTAGMRETEDVLESMSIEMTREQLQRADRVAAVFDNSRPFDREDEGILNALHPWLNQKNSGGLQLQTHERVIIPLVNKCDLPSKLDTREIESAIGKPICSISAQNRDGLDGLYKRLLAGLDTGYKHMSPVVFNKRQWLLLARADEIMKQESTCLTANKLSDKALQILDEVKDIFRACLQGN